MKQTILRYDPRSQHAKPACLGRLVLLWGLYGLVLSWLWQLAGGGGAQAAVWAVAAIGGLGLLISTWGTQPWNE